YRLLGLKCFDILNKRFHPQNLVLQKDRLHLAIRMLYLAIVSNFPSVPVSVVFEHHAHHQQRNTHMMCLLKKTHISVAQYRDRLAYHLYTYKLYSNKSLESLSQEPCALLNNKGVLQDRS